MKRLPSYAISVSVSVSRSAMISGQGAGATETCNALLQLHQHEREEAVEHVTADGLVELVEDRAGGAGGLAVFGRSAPLLHSCLREHSLQWIEIGVGTRTASAVELLLRLDLVGIDRKVSSLIVLR